MGALDGRVAIVTGAGGGIGREHALLFASDGARVVVNDLGGAIDGSGGDATAAQAVVDEIVAAGGEAVANHDSVSDWDGAERMVRTALEAFGDLHAVVNNAGILRDRTLVNMTESDFDAVVAVHLKGTFALTRHASAYWRDQAKAGDLQDRSVVNTSSSSGLEGNPGQANYAAAKAGIAAFTAVAAKELARYGVRVNAIAPVARTRMTLQTPGLPEVLEQATAAAGYDLFDPRGVSTLVAALCADGSPFTGQTFSVLTGSVGLYRTWSIDEEISNDGAWEVAELLRAMDKLPGSIPVRTQETVLRALVERGATS